MMDRVQFFGVINRLKIRKDFFLTYCHEFLQRDPPGSQNPLDYLKDVGQLSFESISDELAAYIASEGGMIPDCQKLLQHYGKFATPSEPASKSDPFMTIVNKLKVSPGYHAANVFCIDILQIHPEKSPWDELIQRGLISSTNLDASLKHWFSLSAYKNNPNVREMFAYYEHLPKKQYMDLSRFLSEPIACAFDDQPSAAPAPTEPLVVQTSNECKICFENPKDMIFLPCGHFCACESCATSPSVKACPICRQNIEERKKVFE